MPISEQNDIQQRQTVMGIRDKVSVLLLNAHDTKVVARRRAYIDEAVAELKWLQRYMGE